MHGLITEFLHYIQNATRYKWVSLAVAWVICLGGWVFVSQMPDVYTATTRVHVDTRSILRPLLQGLAIQPDVSSQIKLMTRLIFSRPNIEKIARMTDLDLGVKDEKAMEKLVKEVQDALKIEGGENNLFTIGYTNPDPKTAKKVDQAVLTLFVEQSLGQTREDSDSAQKFLEQQIKEHEVRLQSAEQAREEYKRSNYALMSGTSGNNDLYTQLNQLASLQEEAKLKVQEGIQRRDQIQRQLENEEPMIESAESGGTITASTPTEERIQNLKSKLDDLLLRYTDKHPQVVTLKKSIADLEKQKKAENVAAGIPENSATGVSKESNPVYQQLKILYGEAEANLASLEAREKAYQSKMEMLKQQMDERLKIETQLAGLNRDYDTVKTNYNQLLAKRETARMSGNMEQTTDAVKFRIVDPPQVPTKPSAPNRILLSSLVLLGSLIVGIGLAILISLLRPSFGTIQGLRDSTGLAVLGSISMNWIPEIRRRKRSEFMRFMVAVVSLVIVYVGVILLEIKGINLRHLPI